MTQATKLLLAFIYLAKYLDGAEDEHYHLPRLEPLFGRESFAISQELGAQRFSHILLSRREKLVKVG